MERVALDLGARDGRVEEIQIEVGVVADQDRARAVVLLHRAPYFLEQPGQRFLLRDRRPQRMERIDAGDGQRRRFQLRAGERLDVKAPVFPGREPAVRLQLDQHRCNFQQRIRVRIEAAALDIDHDGHETAEAAGER